MFMSEFRRNFRAILCTFNRVCVSAGMAGVYDLTKHFDYENERGVAELSTMKVGPFECPFKATIA